MAQLEVGGSALDNCSQIDALRKAGDFTAARDKAQVCLEALEQAVTGSVGKLFSASVAGWTRSNIEQDNVLGFSNVTATYTKAEVTATVALTGTASGGGALGGLLGGFARAGLAGTGQPVRVAGLPATVQPDGIDRGDARGRLVLDVLVGELQHAGERRWPAWAISSTRFRSRPSTRRCSNATLQNAIGRVCDYRCGGSHVAARIAAVDGGAGHWLPACR